jgi:hypothetical protein
MNIFTLCLPYHRGKSPRYTLDKRLDIEIIIEDVTCWMVRVTNKMTSTSDDWIYYSKLHTHSYLQLHPSSTSVIGVDLHFTIHRC